MMAPVEDIAGEVRLPEGVSLREVPRPADLERIAGLERAVWGDEDQQSWLVDMLESERAVDPEGEEDAVVTATLTLLVTADGEVSVQSTGVFRTEVVLEAGRWQFREFRHLMESSRANGATPRHTRSGPQGVRGFSTHVRNETSRRDAGERGSGSSP
jgi:hypothetical protein